MPNLSWLYYKGYYDGFTRWNDPQAKNDLNVQQFFETKNKNITDTELSLLSLIHTNSFDLETTYPGLLTGSGYAHGTGMAGETKIGFHFDHTTGIPVIPGSTVKGVLRSAFPQFKPHTKEPWLIRNINTEAEKSKVKARYIGKDLLGWTDDDEKLFSKVHQLEQHIFEGLYMESSIRQRKNTYCSLHERDIFYDAFPVKGAGSNGKKILGMDAITPHGNPLKNPIPLLFVKILPAVTIRFNFKLNAPIFLDVDANQRKVLFGKILLDTGRGAKTNVGYGQFKYRSFKTNEEILKGGFPSKEKIEALPQVYTSKRDRKL